MSRHNRRRRRSHRPNSGGCSTYWAHTNSNTFAAAPLISSYSSMPRSCPVHIKSKEYSLFWNPMDGKNPWADQAPPDTGVEYLWRRGKPLPPGIALSRTVTPAKRKPSADPVMLYDYPEELLLSHGTECDPMCETMFSVVGFLFKDDDFTNTPNETNRYKRFAGDRKPQKLACRSRPVIPEDHFV